MGRFTKAFKGLFAKDEPQEEVKPIESFTDLAKGNSFTIKMCDVYEVMGNTFEILDTEKHTFSMDHTATRTHTVRDIETNEVYRAACVLINGRQMVRLDKEMTTEQVGDLFFDFDWEPAETEEAWTDPTDFRALFTEGVDVTVAFKLKRFNMGEEATVEAFKDWTVDEYSFHENLGIEGYIEKNGVKEAVQAYFLTSPNKDYAVMIEVDEQGIARVFASHLMLPTSIVDMI